jgi:beta-glucosidase
MVITRHSLSLAAGLDQEQPSSGFFNVPGMSAAIAAGSATEAGLNHSVLNVLTPMFAMGLFDGGGGGGAGHDALAHSGNTTTNVSTAQNVALCRTLASNATVLLQNEGGLLPLDPALHRRVAVIGVAADSDPIVAGLGSGMVFPAFVATPFWGIRGTV